MSPSSAGVSNRRSRQARATPQRRTALRRRRSLLVIAAIGLAAIIVAIAMPALRKTINEFTLPLSNADIIREQAAAKHLDPALIAAVIYAETKFDPRPSSAGAQGLMQILPQTAEFLAHRSGATTFTLSDLATPAVNIAYGSYYLRFLLDHYRSTMLALAAYNAGEANVDRWVQDAQHSGRALTAGTIPFPETRGYVCKGLQARRDYRRTYATELGYR